MLRLHIVNIDRSNFSSETTVKFYRSNDATIDSLDTNIGIIETVPSLQPNATSRHTLEINVPLDAGDYYYGACVTPVTGETDITNNCTYGIRLHIFTPLEESQRIGFDNLNITNPKGIWSDGTTMWVTDPSMDTIFAYDMTTKLRNTSRDIANVTIGGGIINVSYIWSDGTTMWGLDRNENRMIAYDLATGLTIQTISLNLESNYTIADSNITLSATSNLGFTDFTYTSSNPSVASVLGNQLDFLSAGVTTIAAIQIGDANHRADSVSIDVRITGTSPQTVSFSLSQTDYTTASSPVTLSATASSGLEVTFSANNNDVVMFSGNLLNFIGVGTTEIRATQRGNSIYSSVTSSLSISVNSGVLGVTPVDFLIVYPNPSFGIFHLSRTADVVRIYDTEGRIIYRGRNIKKLDITNKPAGQYIIELDFGKEKGKYIVIKE